MLSPSTIQLLRLPFSIFLSPLYFFALSQVPEINWGRAALIFFILHCLIYPASNGYNSYMDRDTESIGGLEKPPPPSKQLFRLTIVMDMLAVLLSWLIHPLFAGMALLYIGASKAYSYRGIRLKKYPVIGYLTVIIFQGALTFSGVYFGSSAELQNWGPWQGMVICALLIGGFYPLTQVYQHRQDKEDGVTTISYALGYRGTFVFCALVYAAAFAFMAQFFIDTNQVKQLWVVGSCFVPVIVYFIGWFAAVWKNTAAADFGHTMKMTWTAAICTNIAFISILIWKGFE